MTSQILEYAETGRLIEGPHNAEDEKRGTVAIVVTASLVLGGGLSLAADGALSHGGHAVTLVAVMCTLGSFAILVPSIRMLRTARPANPVKVRPAAVLQPELVRSGNWIHRNGAWLRVEQIGRDGGGRIHALVSSGELLELSTPVTIAGDEFRPSKDPVAALRD